MSVAASSYAAAVTSTRPVPVRKPEAHGRCRSSPTWRRCSCSSDNCTRSSTATSWPSGSCRTAGRRDRAFGRLREHRILLDWLTTALVARSAQVPAAEPAYVPSVNPRSDATAARLIVSMEIALAPFCGLWLAAANNPERARAFSTLCRHRRHRSSVGSPDQRVARLES